MSTASLGDLPLDPLEVGDGPSEGLALLDVLGGVHQRPLGQADAPGGHDRAHGIESQHGQPEPAHLADHVFGRYPNPVEHQFAGVDAAHPHLVIGPSDRDPVPVPLDDEGGDRVVGPGGRVTRLGEDRVPVGLADTRTSSTWCR